MLSFLVFRILNRHTFITYCRQYKLLLDKRTDSKPYKAIGSQND